MSEQEVFDPRGLLAALDRNYVSYVLIGGLARVIRGTDELTAGVDVCPSLRPENLERLGRSLEELDARRVDRRRLSLDEETLVREAVIRLRTGMGELKLVAEPAGTRRGFEDLRRASTNESIGEGLRPRVASVADLARMSAALAHEHERGVGVGVRWSGCGSSRSGGRVSCGGSWRPRSGCGRRSGVAARSRWTSSLRARVSRVEAPFEALALGSRPRSSRGRVRAISRAR